MSKRLAPAGTDKAAVQSQLARIMASPVFAKAERLRRFLRFSVESVLAGNAATVKEHTIGVGVYDRDPTYDVRLDPIVRVEAARLRAKLREYYETDGDADPLLIEVPKGTYVPRWCMRPVAATALKRGREVSSIAVLPFANLSGDASDEYFSDGLTEELIHVIGRTTGLRVVARTSVFHFKGKTDDVRTIGARLGVAMVLEGSVRRCGDRVRITAHFVDATDGCEIWTDAYDRRIADVIGMQQELASAIAGALRVRIIQHRGADRLVAPKAHDLYLRGRHLFNRRTVTDVERAIELYAEALTIQPEYHVARGGLAICHSLLAYWEIDKAHHMTRAVEEAQTALAATPDVIEAYIALAHARIQEAWDWNGAERYLRTALATDPSASEVHHLYAYFCLLPAGRLEQALESLEHALTLDPLSPDLHATLGRTFTLAGQHAEALRRLHAGLELAPAFREIHWQIGLAHEQGGDYEQALRAFERAGELSASGGANTAGTIGHCLARAGRSEDARRLLDPDLHPAPRALIHLGLGETEEAVTALESAAAVRHRLLMWLKVDPRFRPLHHHPRYTALLARVGLAPASR